MYLNKWIINKNCNTEDFNITGYSKIISKVLKSRGFKQISEVEDFIKEDYIYKDPFELKDMEKAVKRIKEAIDNDEKIVIYGDYDVDGITSTVLLYLYLFNLGADVSYYIPSREIEGYGLNVKSIEKLSRSCQLIITVDNGITAIEEVNFAKELEVDVIVTDHHKPLDILPDAIAVVDPHREDCNSGCDYLAGVGVVFKLLCALEGNSKVILDRYSDIICLGTVVDVMPLVEENRSLVKSGLKKLEINPCIGLEALMSVCGVKNKDMTAKTISYRLAPKLNSASRMGKTYLGIDLLLSKDKIKAIEIARELDFVNKQRIDIEKKMLLEVNMMINQNPKLISDDIIIIAKSGWNHSISGINASKLMEKYHKPCILISIDGEFANASGRSIPGISLIDAINYCKDYLIKYGGHTAAAGFTLKSENIESFKLKIKEYLKITNEEFSIKNYNIDCEISSRDINIKNIIDLNLLEPYGLGNEQPIFLIKNAQIIDYSQFSDGRYVKLMVGFNSSIKLHILAFNISYCDFIYSVGDIVDLVVTLQLDDYNDRVYPSIFLKDIRPANFDQDNFFYEMYEYKKFKNQEKFDESLVIKNMPNKYQIALIYRFLKTLTDFTYMSQNELIEYILIKLLNYNVGYMKIGFVLDILTDIKVVSIGNRIKILDVKEKANIVLSETYKKLINIKNNILKSNIGNDD